MAQLAAKKYANALFELYRDDSENAETIYTDAVSVLNVLKNEATFRETLLHPRVTAEQKLEIIQNVFTGVNGVLMGFLNVVIRKNREDELVHMLSIFLELAEEHMGLVNAIVYTASPLSDKQLKKLKAKLSDKTNKTVNIEVKEDKSLIGGLRIIAGGFIFDTSVKKRLDDMRISLLS